MPRLMPLVSLLCLSVSPHPVLAQSSPPPDAMPLSQIIQTLEQTESVAYFDEIEWDSDGYWEVEYVTADGAKVEIKVDPVTGQKRHD